MKGIPSPYVVSLQSLIVLTVKDYSLKHSLKHGGTFKTYVDWAIKKEVSVQTYLLPHMFAQ